MNVWVTGTLSEDLKALATEAFRLGVFSRLDEKGPDDGKAMVEVAAGRLSESSGQSLLYVPAGIGGDLPLLENLREFRRPLVVAVNGFGPLDMEKVRLTLEGAVYSFAVDTRGMGDFEILQQLTWLSSQEEPSAVVSDCPKTALLATAMGVDDVVLLNADKTLCQRLRHLAGLASASTRRPLSVSEVDNLSLGEASIVAAVNAESGEILERRHLAVGICSPKGLSPALMEKAVGRVLRYDLEAGTPVTFGILVESGE